MSISLDARLESLIGQIDGWIRPYVDRPDSPAARFYQMMAYHHGWVAPDGTPLDPPARTGKRVRPILAILSCEAFGGTIVRAQRLMHGKTDLISHDNRGLFAGLPNPFEAMRYHSLIGDSDSLPDCLRVTARTADGVIMAVRHREFPIYGVQFHPESILTTHGKQMIRNFLEMIG